MINWSNWTQQQKLLAVAGFILVLAALIYTQYVTTYSLIARVLIVLIAFPVHELAHAVAADRLGDPTPRQYGRITLNPLAHIDPMGSILMLLFGFGWATTPVNPNRLRGNRQLSSIIVSAAGPLSNLLLAALIAIPFRAEIYSSSMLWQVLYTFGIINLLLFVFNLLPIPPLDGFNILANLLPPSMRNQLMMLAQYGSFLLLLLVLLPGGLFSGIIGPPVEFLRELLFGL